MVCRVCKPLPRAARARERHGQHVMPELPDITLYVHALRARAVGRALASLRFRSPFALRTVEPCVEDVEGRSVVGVERLGKRIVLRLDGGVAVVIHLMIAGRLLWKPGVRRPGGKIDVAALGLTSQGTTDTLLLTEASQMKRAGVWIVRGDAGLRALDPGGVEPLGCAAGEFAAALRASNRTLKRALTDPRTISGIGNAYSDEILHAARLSPFKLTGSLSDADLLSLHTQSRCVLERWTRTLLDEFGYRADDPAVVGRFPGVGDVTAFRADFAVHGRFGKPCPACGCKVQRIVRAANEINYCPGCQTGGKVLADRSLSRLLKEDWPSDPADWE